MPRATRRLDRKSLKHDGLVDMTARVTDYMSANANQVLGIAAGVVVILVLAIFWGRGHVHKLKESDVRFSQVVAAFSNGNFDAAVQLATALQGEFGGSQGAMLATYMAGQSQLQLAKFPEAEQSFRNYLSRASKAPFYEVAAKRGLAVALEAQQRYGEAAALYQEGLASMPEQQADEARLDAARALRLAGSYDQAKSLLQAVTSNNRSLFVRRELAVLEGLRGATPAPAPAKNP